VDDHPLPAALLPAIAAARHVSFDVWDTLLRRDCDPDEVKLQSARCLLLSGRRWLREPGLDPAGMLSRRQEAEAAVADAQWEYRFEAALDHWLASVLRADTPPAIIAALRARLLAHEAAAEGRVTRPDRHAASLLDAAEGRASLLSDFYCGVDFVRAVLAGHALDRGFVSAHVSCEVGRTKRHGTLYEDLLGAIGHAPDAVLHIGDNAEADIERARARGLAAAHYEVPGEAARKRWFAEAFHAYRRGDRGPHARRVLALLDQAAAAAADPAFAAGIRLAPLAFGLALAAGEAAYAAGAERVWFFTREGVFLRQVYEAIRAADPYHCPLPESRLLEVSRLATFAPSLARLDVPSLMRLWTLYSSQSLAALCASLNLPASVAARFGPRHGIAPEAIIRYPFEDQRVQALLADAEFQAAAAPIAAQRGLLHRYLREQGFEGGAAALHCVDIGWRGTIQDNLALLTGLPTVGHYLGLFGFLNPQPAGAAKHGYLGDANQPDRPFHLTEVAGLEMLFSQPGGSVTGYAERDGRVVAERRVFAGEEALLTERMAPVQAGMLAAVPLLAGYLGRHGLVAADLAGLANDLAQSLVLHPPAPIAEAFAAHEHNETFGLGEALRFSAAELAPLAGLRQGAVLAAGRAALAGWRWPQALLRTSAAAAALAPLDAAQRAALPAVFNLTRGPALVQSLGDTLAIYAPPPLRGSGGHRTLFNIGRRMSALGWRLTVYLEGTGDGAEVAESFLGDTPARLETRWPQGASSTLALATVAYSGRFVAQVPRAPHKAYLVQDLEAMFEPMGDSSLWNEESYTFGLRHITIGHWLTHLLRDRYRAEAVPAGLGSDTALYRPRPEIPRENAICFLHQPDKPRRAPRHAIEALWLVKQRLPETKIYLYGSPHRAELDFECEQLGLIDDLEQLATLYARCRVGLCLSSSNPSRIPYEMMAAGCVPVDLYRANNLLDHTTGTLRLAYQAADSLSVAMQALLTDPEDWQRRSAAGIAAAAERSLDWEQEAAANHLLDLVRGRPIEADWPLPAPYAEPPVVGELDDRPGVHGFLTHQRAALGPLWQGFRR
jgi:O-antigen biosynthesis protein